MISDFDDSEDTIGFAAGTPQTDTPLPADESASGEGEASSSPRPKSKEQEMLGKLAESSPEKASELVKNWAHSE